MSTSKFVFQGSPVRARLGGSAIVLRHTDAPWESFADLEAALDGGSGTLDLSGRRFRPLAGESAVVLSSTTSTYSVVQNLDISGGLASSWQASGTAGVWYTNIDDANWGDSFRVYLEDPYASDNPLFSIYVDSDAAGSKDANRFARSNTWFDAKGAGYVINTDSEDGSLVSIEVPSGADRTRIDAALSLISFSGGYKIPFLWRANTNLIQEAWITGWDESSGTISLETDIAPASSYLEFCIGSHLEWIESGEYAIDLHHASGARLYYKPTNGSEPSSDICIPYLSSVLRVASSLTTSFEDCELRDATNGTGSITSALVQVDSGTPSVSFTRCNFHGGRGGMNGFVPTADQCRFYRLWDRGISAKDGTTVTRSRFTLIENRSCINLSGGTTGAVDKSTVQGCLFNAPATVHGQAISLYSGTWANAMVEENVFIDHMRAFRFAGSVEDSSDNTQTVSLYWQNNLTIINSERSLWTYADNGIGQPTWKMAATIPASSTNLSGNKVVYRYNSMVINPSFFTGDALDSGVYSRLRLDTRLIVDDDGSDRMPIDVYGNIGWNMDQPSETSDTSSFFRVGYNGWYTDTTSANIFGATDLDGPSNSDDSYTDLFSYSSLTPTGAYSNGASDGGKIGVRWGTYAPTVSDLTDDSLSLTWSDSITAATLTEPSLGGVTKGGSPGGTSDYRS